MYANAIGNWNYSHVCDFGLSGDQVVLLRSQGSCLWRMYMLPGAPNLCGMVNTIMNFDTG